MRTKIPNRPPESPKRIIWGLIDEFPTIDCRNRQTIFDEFDHGLRVRVLETSRTSCWIEILMRGGMHKKACKSRQSALDLAKDVMNAWKKRQETVIPVPSNKRSW